MKKSETRTINGTKYRIYMREDRYRRVVIVYPEEDAGHESKKELKKPLRGSASMSLEKMVAETLNEAVCDYEEKQAEEQRFQNKIDRVIDAVKEVHE